MNDMKRGIKKQFWFNRDEAQELQRKAKKTCLSEAALVRLLLRDYEPKEKPDERFYDAMQTISEFGNQIQQLEGILVRRGQHVDVDLGSEVKKWREFQDRMEKEFLLPRNSEAKWRF